MRDHNLTFEEAVARDAERIRGDMDAALKFANRALDMQKNAYDENYANMKYNFSLAVLREINANPSITDALDMFHNIAIEEIRAGKRSKPVKKIVKPTSLNMHGDITYKNGEVMITTKIDSQDLLDILAKHGLIVMGE